MLGDLIRQQLAARGVKASRLHLELARAGVTVSRQTVNKWLNGKVHRLEQENLTGLMDVLVVPLETRSLWIAAAGYGGLVAASDERRAS